MDEVSKGSGSICPTVKKKRLAKKDDPTPSHACVNHKSDSSKCDVHIQN